jgi:hypothetical protein
MAEESVTVRIRLSDAITAGLVVVEKQAKRTGRALEGMDADIVDLNTAVDDNTKSMKKNSVAVHQADKGLRGLRLKALDLGFVFKTLKIPALLAAVPMAVSGINALAGGLTSLIGPLARAGGLIGAVPAGIVALGSTMGVIKLATSGVGDLLKVMTKEGATVKEVNEAMKGQSAETIRFARALASLNPKLKEMRQVAAKALLPFLSDALRRLMPLLPMITHHLGVLAGVLGRVAEKASKLMASGPFARDLDTILARNGLIVQTLGDALIHVVNAIRNVTVAAGPMAQRLAEMVRNGAGWLSWMSEVGRSSGRLERFFDHALDTTRRLGRTLRDLGIALYNVIKAGTGFGDEMYGGLEKLAAQFRKWTESVRGQNAIADWYKDSRAVLVELGKIIQYLGTVWGKFGAKGNQPGGLVDTLRVIRVEALPAIANLIMGLKNGLGPAIGRMVSTIARLMNVASFDPLVKGATIVADFTAKLMDFVDKHPIVSKMATALVAVGLSLKTGVLVGKLSGLDKLGKFVKFMKAPSAVEGVSRFGRVLDGVGSALGFLISPVGLVIAAIALLGVALYVAYRKSKPFHEFIDRLWQATQKLWDEVLRVVLPVIKTYYGWLWKIAQVVWDVFLKFTPLGIFLNHFKDDILPKVITVVSWLWDKLKEWIPTIGRIIEKFTPLGRIFEFIRDHWPEILDAAKRGWDLLATVVKLFADNLQKGIDKMREFKQVFDSSAIGKAWNAIPGNAIEGAAITKAAVDRKTGGASVAELVNRGLDVLFGKETKTTPRPKASGDTTRPRARTGALQKTLRSHAYASAASPGKQRVTNVLYGQYAGSDHVNGRALDLIGSGLNTYAKNVRAMGGYAEHHGSGPDRHLHAAFGDTARPRAKAMSGGRGDTFEFNAPLVGQVVANQEIDVERAVQRGIRAFVREREERR